MFTLTTYEAPKAVKVTHVGVNDVIATKFGKKGEPQAARSILAIEDVKDKNGKVTSRKLTLGFPKRGEQTGVTTVTIGKNVAWIGHVTEGDNKPKATPKVTKPKAQPKAAAKPKAAPKPKASPEPKARPTQPTLLEKRAAEPKAQPKATLADRIAAKLQDKLGAVVENALDKALDQAIDQALAQLV